ncbi:MAG: hypothetical protein KF706_12565 [Chitinophagales bacterium]|nr:hypothetical protein [Chitinophagales bacterium]
MLFLHYAGHKKIPIRNSFYELSLDGLVPQDNFYRKVNRELEFGFYIPKNQKILWYRRSAEH